MLPYDPKWAVPPGQSREPPRTQGPRRGGSIGPAFKWTFFPVLALSIFSLLGAASEGLYWTWFIAAGYGAIALIIGVMLALISFFDVGDTVRNAAAGMVAGAAVGALVLTVTCFINLSTVGSVFE